MKLAVEISLYPLSEDYIEYIQAFIDKLNTYDGLFVETTQTSTLISGDYDLVAQVMHTELKVVYEQVGQAIFVCKYLNATHMALNN